MKTISILNYVMLAAFVLSVAVQYNDPDPLVWMLVYGAAAAACLLFALRRLPWAVPAAVGLVALVWLAALVPDVLGKVGFGEMFESIQMKDPRVEVGREAGGLFLIVAWMAVLAVAARRAAPATSREPRTTDAPRP